VAHGKSSAEKYRNFWIDIGIWIDRINIIKVAIVSKALSI
jgi:hypothetical protein